MRAGESQNYSYYKEFCRLHCAHAILNEKLAALISEKEELAKKLSRIKGNKRTHEEAVGVQFEIPDDKRKRHRRTAGEIARNHKCPIDDCPKAYGSEGSLN